MNEVVVRDARPEDDAAVGELLLRAFLDKYAVKLPDVVYGPERRAELRDVAKKRQVAKVFVAELGGQLAGTVAVWPPGAPGSEAWLPDAVDLRHLAVDARFQGRGVSAALMDRAEAHARSLGADTVCLHVRRGVHGVARLYVGRGYRRDPTGDLELPEVSLDAYWLPIRSR